MLRKPPVLHAAETNCRNLQDYHFSGDPRAVQELDVVLVHILKVSQLILWNAHSSVTYFAKCPCYKGNENLISTLTLQSVLLNLPVCRRFLAGQ